MDQQTKSLMTINHNWIGLLYDALSVVLNNIVLFEYKTKEGEII